jgi:hypothetical protein
MWSPEELARDRAECRLKMKRDIFTALAEAHREGYGQGYEEAYRQRRMEMRIQLLCRFIRLCQRILDLDETPEDQLRALPLEDLEKLAAQL